MYFSLGLGQCHIGFVIHQIGKERSFLVSFAIEIHHLLACRYNRVVHVHCA